MEASSNHYTPLQHLEQLTLVATSVSALCGQQLCFLQHKPSVHIVPNAMSQSLNSHATGSDIPQTPALQPNEQTGTAVGSPEDSVKRWARRFQADSCSISRSVSAGDLIMNPLPREKMQISLHLSVAVKDTSYGDRVVISGNNDALGLWMVDGSPSLSTSADTFPVWNVAICMVLRRSMLPLEFKFAIVRHASGFVVSLRLCVSWVVLSVLHSHARRTGKKIFPTECCGHPPKPFPSLTRFSTFRCRPG